MGNNGIPDFSRCMDIAIAALFGALPLDSISRASPVALSTINVSVSTCCYEFCLANGKAITIQLLDNLIAHTCSRVFPCRWRRRCHPYRETFQGLPARANRSASSSSATDTPVLGITCTARSSQSSRIHRSLIQVTSSSGRSWRPSQV